MKYIAAWIILTGVFFLLSWFGCLGFSMAYIIATGATTVLGTIGSDAVIAGLIVGFAFVARN